MFQEKEEVMKKVSPNDSQLICLILKKKRKKRRKNRKLNKIKSSQIKSKKK